jgi:hypothetical protein
MQEQPSVNLYVFASLENQLKVYKNAKESVSGANLVNCFVKKINVSKLINAPYFVKDSN